MCVAVVAVVAATASPTQFQLVFDGHHGAPMGTGFRHEGPFTAAAPFCSSGTVVDLQHLGTSTALRLNTCADGSGTVTMRVTDYQAEHLPDGAGTWRITEGTGAYATLRGHGRWTTVPIGGENESFRATLTGIADFDAVAPTITIPRARATKLRRPRGAYLIAVALALQDNVAGNAIAYTVTVTAGDSVVSRSGQTSTGSVTTSLRVRPARGVRRVSLDVAAVDPVGNERHLVRRIALPLR